MMNNSGNIPNLMVPLIVAGFVLAGIVLGLAVGPIYGWALLAVGMFASMMIGRPRLILIIYWLWSSVMELAETLSSNPAVRFADELLVLAIVGICIMEYVTHRKTYPELRGFLRLATLLVGITVLSAALNVVPSRRVLHFFLSYLSFIPIFYLAYQVFRPRDYRLIFRMMVAMFFVQFGLNLGWWIRINPLPNAFLGATDFARGALGAANVVAYLAVVVIVMAFAAWRTRPGFIPRTCFAILALCGIIQLYITYTVHAYLVLLGAFIVYYILVFRDLQHRWIPPVMGVLTLSALLLLDMTGGSSSVLGQGQRRLFSKENLVRRISVINDGPKGQTLRQLLLTVPKSDPLAPVIGGGPGNFLSSIGIINIVPKARDLVGDYYLTYSGRMEMVGGSILQHPVTGYVVIFSELGIIGFVLYFGLFGYAVVRVVLQHYRREYTHVDQRLLSQVFIVLGAVYLFVNLFSEFFYFDFWQLSFWLLAACVWTPFHPEQPGEEAEEESSDGARDGGRRSILFRLYRHIPSMGRGTGATPTE